MQHIMEWVRENQVFDFETLAFDESDILRFCRARKFDRSKIKAMFENFVQWRAAEDV